MLIRLGQALEIIAADPATLAHKRSKLHSTPDDTRSVSLGNECSDERASP
jgi:hypothetical protein